MQKIRNLFHRKKRADSHMDDIDEINAINGANEIDENMIDENNHVDKTGDEVMVDIVMDDDENIKGAECFNCRDGYLFEEDGIQFELEQ